MRLLIQRVNEAKVTVDGRIVGSIGKGLLVLFAVRKDDVLESVKWLAQKLVHLGCFEDAMNKMNLSLLDIQGEVLIVSQFTLYGNCASGRRPDFFAAETPQKAEHAYDMFIQEVGRFIPKIQTGIFGAYMQVHLINDGPVTFLIDSPS